MTALVFGAVLAATTLSAGAPLAQTKVINGEQKTVTATVEAIDASSRSVTVKKPDGNYDVLYVPSEIKRFDTLKIGDTVKVRYYENMVLTVKHPGEKSVDTSKAAVTRAADHPTGTAAHQRIITATITHIDPNVPSITFTGPNNWKYSTRVEDKAALAKVKVGDKVEITWTEAMILSLDEGK
jgi:hypothetical protein